MNYMEQDYQKKQIEANQKFLLGLLNFNIGNYYPLRKWLGIDYKGKIDEISHLSFAYNTKYFKKDGKWYKQQTRVYQQPDLGYKLNLVLDKIPQLALLPALLQPAFRLASVLLFSLTTTTYQPSTKDTYMRWDYPDKNYGSETLLICYGRNAGATNHDNVLIHWNTTDIPNGATFSQGDIALYQYDTWQYNYNHYVHAYRCTQTGWTESGATFNKYDGTNAWTTAGGDYTTTNGVQGSLCHGNTAEWITWSASTLIQDCYNNQSKNVNLLFRNDNETSTEMASRFRSREYSDTSLRPKLTVTYTVPVKDNSIFFSCNF